MKGVGFGSCEQDPFCQKKSSSAFTKAYPGILPMILVGETLAVSSITILDAQSAMLWVGIGTAALSFGLSGIAVGMGAIYPDFKTNNASKLAASPAGLFYMLTALGLVFAVLALEAFPVYWLISTQITDRPITDTQWIIGSVCCYSPWDCVCLRPSTPSITALVNCGKENCPMVPSTVHVRGLLLILVLGTG